MPGQYFQPGRELALLNADWEDFQQRKDSFEPNRQRLELARKALLWMAPLLLCAACGQQERTTAAAMYCCKSCRNKAGGGRCRERGGAINGPGRQTEREAA